MRLVIVTGMSGAGKSLALKFLEDIGFFCVDNLPPALIPKFAEIFAAARGDEGMAALGADIRGGALLNELLPAVNGLAATSGVKAEILYLDASDETLVHRYSETRRVHPLAKDGRTAEGIAREREIVENIKRRADYVIDTSRLLTKQLKEQINNIFYNNQRFDSLVVTVASFGFKYGVPADADLVFDVRFLPNPFYDEGLRLKTGDDADVADFVGRGGALAAFMVKLLDMLDFLLPKYVDEGKNKLVIAIGCTGGKHRSVTVARGVYNYLLKTGRSVFLSHRDKDNN